MNPAHYLTHPNFDTPHAFFGRHGGVSSGIYDSLNCGIDTGDSKENAQENRERAAKLFNLSKENLCTLKQIHSPNVITLHEPLPHSYIQGDALVTKTPGIILGVLTADCCPILFFDAKAKVIGAAHAGWRGAFAGIALNTINAMENLGAHKHNIHVVTGPAIGQSSYEVSDEFYQTFLSQSAHHKQFFKTGKPGHYYFNLRAYIDRELQTLPLASIYHIERDTCAEPDMFFSYRRNFLNQNKGYGCQLSAISLVE